MKHPVFIVLVSYAVEPGDITMIVLGRLHGVVSLIVGKSIEREALTISKFGNKAVSREI